MKVILSTLSLALITLISCSENDTSNTKILPATVNIAAIETLPKVPTNENYWYNNEAEISSYALKQARYGEIHEGKAVLIYVTEPFSTKSGTKADNPTDKDISVLKLNATKKFNTGIYPYSMMTSSFFPFEKGEQALKISSSVQEWCGHTYMELINNKEFEINLASYFEGASKSISLDKANLEDDIWSKIRLQPTKLPTGKHKLIPSFAYLGLMHKALKAYDCTLSTKAAGDNTIYTISYPDLEREVSIRYETAFPHRILSWEETYASGWGEKKKVLTTSATLLKTIKSDYWSKHTNEDSGLRVELGLN